MSTQRVFNPVLQDEIPSIEPQELNQNRGKVLVIDVRRPDEFSGELGHIEGAQLVTSGNDLTQFLDARDRNEEIVFVCRSGGRSGAATRQSIEMGFKRTINMKGGMLLWNQLDLPTVGP
jgi:rhodanese-related sulfurtransferase